MTKARQSFYEALEEQRWDDHRFYHQSRINQSLHLFSACCFLTSYVLLAFDPVTAVLVGWLVAWVSRQIGHFFFEPKAYDRVNDITHEGKEAIKVGYNLFRKYVLLSLFLAAPFVLALDGTFFGAFYAWSDLDGFLHHLSVVWLGLGAGALLFRTVQLFFIRDVQTGLVWFTKILTDPFNDVRMYWRSPFHLFRGELFDPIHGDEASRA